MFFRAAPPTVVNDWALISVLFAGRPVRRAREHEEIA
jgi:hypothetical protein